MKKLLLLSLCLVMVGYSEVNAMEYKYNESWKSPKGQPYFDSVLHVNDTGHDLICSVCGGLSHPIHNRPGRGIYTKEDIIKLNPDYEKYEVSI